MNFNLEVSQDPKEISKILTDVRYLLKDVVLPQILRQEIELKQLREQTWPVCQSIREQSQISDIANKIEFLNDLDFNIAFTTPANFVDLTDDWDIVSRTDTKIQLIDVS